MYSYGGMHKVSELAIDSTEFNKNVGHADAMYGVECILRYIGEDHQREALLDTPARVVKAFREFTEGYGMDPHEILSKHFELDDDAQLQGKGYDQMIISKDILFTSLCE